MTDMTELGRRAVACKHWRWMPGMLTPWSTHIDFVDDDGRVPNGYKGMLPDLTDPATLGCLLALVRERYRKGTSVIMDGDGRYYVMFVGIPIASGDTEAEALVAALEAR